MSSMWDRPPGEFPMITMYVSNIIASFTVLMFYAELEVN